MGAVLNIAKLWIIGALLILPILADAESRKQAVADKRCQECHGFKGFAVPLGERGDDRKKALFVDEGRFRNSAHGQFACVDCHRDTECVNENETLDVRI